MRGSAAGEHFSRKVLLTDGDTVVDVGDVDWIVANVGGHGFYRTHYSDDLFAGVLGHLDELDDLERYWLVSDTLALVRNGEIDASAFLDLVVEFAAEREQAIWSVITGGLATIEHHALEAAARPAYEVYVRSVVAQQLDRLGPDPSATETDLDRKLRGDLIVTLGILGRDPATIERCARIVDDVLEGAEVDPEVATAALAVFAHDADRSGYERLWSAYLGARTPIEQARFLRAVADVGAVELATATLDRIVDGSIRTQDRAWVFARLLSGDAGPTVWRRATERLGRVPGRHSRADALADRGGDLRPVPTRHRRRGRGVPRRTPPARGRALGTSEPRTARCQRPPPGAPDARGHGLFRIVTTQHQRGARGHGQPRR